MNRSILSNHVVEGIGDLHVAFVIDGQVHRIMEQRLAARTVPVAQPPGSGGGGDFAGRGDFADWPSFPTRFTAAKKRFVESILQFCGIQIIKSASGELQQKILPQAKKREIPGDVPGNLPATCGRIGSGTPAETAR